MTRRFALIACLALAAASFATGCKREPAKGVASTQPAPQPVVKNAERGPVKVTVRLNRDRTSVADPVELSIEAKTEPGVEVRMPKFGEVAQGLSIRDFTDKNPKSDDKNPTWTRTYKLESFVSGKVELPPVKVDFTDRRPRPGATSTQPAIASSVEVEPISLTVESLLAGKFDPQKFNDVKGAVALARPRSWIILAWGAGAVAVLLAIGAMVWYVRRRREIQRQVQMPPHQWALIELHRLLAEDLVGKGMVAEFYYRLNGLLRRYIELRFGLNAAEQTSEEFIRALQTDNRLPREHVGALRDFVAACDPVKYARYLPESAEIEQVFNAARDFILSTQQRELEIELEPEQAVAA